jgi:hypothetical protein
MIGGNRLPPFLGVEPSCDLGRANQITEQHVRWRRSPIAEAATAGASPALAAGASLSAAHSPQNLSPGWIGAPHFGQEATRGVPQVVQNLRPSRLPLLNSNNKACEEANLLRSVPRVGPVLCSTLIAGLPELGTLPAAGIGVGGEPVGTRSETTPGSGGHRGGERLVFDSLSGPQRITPMDTASAASTIHTL